MAHIYTTHIVQADSSVQCKHCRNMLKEGDEFAVTSTPSKPFQINCLPCTDQRLDAQEKGLRIDNTTGDHPGTKRSVQ